MAGGRQQGTDAFLQASLPVWGQAFLKARFRFACGPHDQQPVFPWHQIGARPEYHPLQGPFGCLQGEHLALDREDRQLGQQLATPGPARKYCLTAGHAKGVPFCCDQTHPLECAACVFEQFLHFAAFLKLHAQANAGPLQGPHQLAAVVNLAVLAEQQACLPTGSDAWHFPLQALAIQACAPGRGWVAVPFLRGSEGDDDAAVSQATAQAAVCFDLGYPGGDLGQAGLAQLQEGA